jgi:hypothetical protein
VKKGNGKFSQRARGKDIPASPGEENWQRGAQEARRKNHQTEKEHRDKGERDSETKREVRSRKKDLHRGS